MNLRDVLEGAAAELEPIEWAEAAGGVEWRRDGAAFATISSDGRTGEFRLDPLVATAALRTPDTAPSTRGGEWVRFAPAVLDGPAIDRAEAWFASAWRRSAPGN